MLYHFIAFSAAVATGAADADCVGYFYKINGVCTGVQQFPGATGCGSANGGKDSHPIAVDKAFCQEFGTARVPADQQVGGVSWGNLGKVGAAQYVGEVDDPTLPSGCVAHSNQNTYQWNNAASGASYKWWSPVCMTVVEMPAPSAPPSMPPTELTKCKEYTPDRAMSIKNGADSVAVQLCKVKNGNVMTPMWDNGKASDCGTDAALIAAATNSIHDCMALCDAHPDCLGWWMWDQSTLPAPYTKDDQGCYLFENGTADQLVPDRVMDSAVAAGVCFPEAAPGTEMQGCCRGASGVGMEQVLNVASAKDCYDTCIGLLGAELTTYEYGFDTPAAGNTAKRCWCYRNAVATHSDTGSDPRCAAGARSCFVLGSDSTPSAPPTAPSAPPTAPSAPPTAPSAPPSSPPTVNTDCQKVQLKSGGMCLHTQGPNATSMWMTCPAPGTNDPLFQFDIIPVATAPDHVMIRNSRGQYVSFQSPWMDPAMTRDLSGMYHQVWERRVSSAGVQFYNAGRGAFLASDPSVNNGFAGFTTTDSPTASTFAAESAGCAAPPTMPPTEPPTECNCRRTDSTFAEGAKCMGPAGETIGYRQTANWCCSDYGCSKGYRWVNPAEDVCHDDDFVGTCMFNFIQAGGCDMTGSDDTIMASVDPACFDCDNIGPLVDQECMGAPSALHILSDMIDDARRLDGTPLPAGDAQLQKINKRISKIRTLLKDKKIDAKTALGKHP